MKDINKDRIHIIYDKSILKTFYNILRAKAVVKPKIEYIYHNKDWKNIYNDVMYTKLKTSHKSLNYKFEKNILN